MVGERRVCANHNPHSRDAVAQGTYLFRASSLQRPEAIHTSQKAEKAVRESPLSPGSVRTPMRAYVPVNPGVTVSTVFKTDAAKAAAFSRIPKNPRPVPGGQRAFTLTPRMGGKGVSCSIAPIIEDRLQARGTLIFSGAPLCAQPGSFSLRFIAPPCS